MPELLHEPPEQLIPSLPVRIRRGHPAGALSPAQALASGAPPLDPSSSSGTVFGCRPHAIGVRQHPSRQHCSIVLVVLPTSANILLASYVPSCLSSSHRRHLHVLLVPPAPTCYPRVTNVRTPSLHRYCLVILLMLCPLLVLFEERASNEGAPDGRADKPSACTSMPAKIVDFRSSHPFPIQSIQFIQFIQKNTESIHQQFIQNHLINSKRKQIKTFNKSRPLPSLRPPLLHVRAAPSSATAAQPRPTVVRAAAARPWPTVVNADLGGRGGREPPPPQQHGRGPPSSAPPPHGHGPPSSMRIWEGGAAGSRRRRSSTAAARRRPRRRRMATAHRGHSRSGRDGRPGVAAAASTTLAAVAMPPPRPSSQPPPAAVLPPPPSGQIRRPPLSPCSLLPDLGGGAGSVPPPPSAAAALRRHRPSPAAAAGRGGERRGEVGIGGEVNERGEGISLPAVSGEGVET
uniref:Uncharacterized protein n=1 Tax=Oryza sativa subsp. japonica TaxID=39947 RepID=Q654H4_ORYSJ|nr:hypothetical protein [Oryza sativa Japonica Group]